MHQAGGANRYDVAVVGAGIVGMAHALAAARAGAKVALIEAQQRCVGASIRNFGFVTVTGQERHDMWPLARRAREVWGEVADAAGIEILQSGLVMTARRDAAVAVLEEFLATEMGEGCRLVDGAALRAAHSQGAFSATKVALVSPHEIRIEPRLAVPAILDLLREQWRVDVVTDAAVIGVEPGSLRTTARDIHADSIFVCPGDQVGLLFPDLARAMGVVPCKLQMMRLAAPGFRLPAPVMSDLGLARYEGYAALPAAAALKAQLAIEQPRLLEWGIHLIAVQAADGSLVVGDSHEYGPAPDPFIRSDIDALILEEYAAVLGPPPPVMERWMGVYAWSADRNWFSQEVQPGVHVSVVTCGAGMSTGFAIGEKVVSAALKL